MSSRRLTLPRRPPGLVGLVSVLLLFESSLYSAITPVLPHYQQMLHVGKPAMGILSASYTAGLIPGALLSGWLASRVGVRRTTVIGLVVFAVFAAAFGFGTSLYALDGLRFVQGVACGGIWGGALTWVIATAPRERRATVIGSVIAAATFGTLLGPLLGTLAVAAGTQVVFSTVGVISLGLAVWASTYPEPERVSAAEPGTPERRWRFTPALVLGTWLIALEAMTYGAVNVLIPLRMAHLGSPELVIGAAFLATAAVGTVVGPLVGRITDRLGPRPVLSVGIVISALLLPTLAVVPTYVLIAVMLVITLGIPMGAYMTPAMTLMSDSAERAGITLVFVTTLFNLSYASGETIGAPAAAAVSQATSDAVPLVAIGVLMLLTLFPARAIAGGLQTGSSVTSRLTSAA